MLTGTVVYQTPIGDAFIERFGYPCALMHRGDLFQILVSACKASDRITLKTYSRLDGEGADIVPELCKAAGMTSQHTLSLPPRTRVRWPFAWR